MEWIKDQANIYAEQHSTEADELLSHLATFTGTYHQEPHMLSGQLQGRLLTMFSQMIRPKTILEIGTLTGYSALCLAEGLSEDGVLHTIECRERDAEVAKEYISNSRFANQIKVHIGSALDVLQTLKFTWDLVFIDADKVNYINYFDVVIDHVKPGGWIIADNVLFHGQVLEEEIKGKNAKAIHAFNEYVKNNDQVECCLLTVRDGLMLIRKKNVCVS